MTPHEYISAAHRTCSDQWHGEKISLVQMRGVLEDAIIALEKLDAIKKALFYGRDVDTLTNVGNDEVLTMQSLPELIEFNLSGVITKPTKEQARNMIHGIIGKATEASELLETLLHAVLHVSPFDIVNIKEEVGDGFWYDALIIKAAASSFEQIQNANIAKLRARFPEKFTEFKANNRDLKTERITLEANK